jgi:hypothetical protein
MTLQAVQPFFFYMKNTFCRLRALLLNEGYYDSRDDDDDDDDDASRHHLNDRIYSFFLFYVLLSIPYLH